MVNRLVRALCILVAIGALLVGGATTLLAREVSRPAASSDEVVEFVVEEGWGIGDIATQLQNEGFITQPLLFRWLAGQQEVKSMQAGTYKLRRNLTMSEIIAILSEQRGGEGGEEVSFTIIPGQRLEEIAATMVERGLAPDAEAFLRVARNPAPFKENHQRLQSIPDGQSLEGYLYPDTYNVFATDTITDVIEKVLTDGFDRNYATFENEVIAQLPDGGQPSVHQIVTMASIIQREAFIKEDMPHISYIFWRRLDPNTPEVNGRLQSDPTLQYVVGTPENWWPDINRTLTAEQINGNESPYNTRRVAGLPPGPISNPGIDALRAAARPGAQRRDGSDGQQDLYFISTCDTNEIKYATSFAEFQPLIAEFQACDAARN